MRELINILVEATQQYYVRFGDLPKNGKSKIGAAPNHYKAMQQNGRTHERGISVYPVEWDAELNRWEIDCNNLASLDGLLSQRRPAYLVTGKETGSWGMDDEPLIRDANIIETIPYDKLSVPGWGGNPMPEEYLVDYDLDEDRAQVNELFDHRQQWSWDRQEPGHWTATFTTGDIPYYVTFSGFNAISITFVAITRDDFGYGPDMGITGTGSAQKVFGTILQIVREFIAERQPREIGFAAKKSQPSRIRLYRKMVTIMGNVPGYTFEEDDADNPHHDAVSFLFTRT